MAKIILGPLVSDARGKEGGLVFSRNRFGPYTRAKISPVQPRTDPQQQIRAKLTYVAQAWATVLTAAERKAWNEYALNTPLTDKFGAKQTMTGLTMFTRFNVQWMRNTAGGITNTLLKAAPSTAGEALMVIPVITVTAHTSIQIASFLPAIPDLAQLMIYESTSPVSQARDFFKGPFQFINYLTNLTALPLSLRTANLAIGQRWYYRFRLFQANGKVGPDSTVLADVTS